MTPTKCFGLKRRAVYEYYERAQIVRVILGKGCEYKPDWRWKLRASNGEILSSGEGYVSKSNVLRAIATHRRAAATEMVREWK